MEFSRSWLFSPGDVPDRCLKALQSDADQVIWDLEDGVGVARKVFARDTLCHLLSQVTRERVPWVRMQSLGDLDHLHGVAPRERWVVPKIDQERLTHIQQWAQSHPHTDRAWLLIVESARGLWDLVRSPTPWHIRGESVRLALGALDFINDMNGHQTEAETELLGPRTILPWISRAWDFPGPIDGVYPVIDDVTALCASTARARALGFAGRMIIHPRQIAPVHHTYRPTTTEREWAEEILSVADSSSGAVRVHGHMVDRPVIEQARRIRDLVQQDKERGRRHDTGSSDGSTDRVL